ncbi:MAG: HPF/RaiA family ribosome-associated protein [Planctomycetales bacterium]|nr:HPF/RaiA family ribosome-associated protein [Planctomycetales bacterium]
MHVQVKSGSTVSLNNARQTEIAGVVEAALERFADRLTGVEVYLSDENSRAKDGGNDKRCVIEARVRNLEPVVARADADTLDAAIDDCAEKLARALDARIGRLADKDGQVSQSGDEPLGTLRGPLPETK